MYLPNGPDSTPTSNTSGGFHADGREQEGVELVWIKLLHTLVWAWFAGCIVGIPIAVAFNRFQWAAILCGIVLSECAILAWNRGTCPLTPVAARYTTQRADNFDIYLPLWLARHNKTIFGTLYLASMLFAAWRWAASGYPSIFSP